MKEGHHSPLPVIAAVITVSSTRTHENDTSGSTIQQLLTVAGIPVAFQTIAQDEGSAIVTALDTALRTANCIIINGGTGLTHDDVTIEAVAPRLGKRIDGFGELFRMLSYQEIGTSAILSRAIAGIIGEKAVFCIPGSVPAVTLATSRIIIPEIRHILTHARRG